MRGFSSQLREAQRAFHHDLRGTLLENNRTNYILKEFVEQIGEIDKCRVTNWLKIVGNEVVDFAQDDV